MGFLGKVIFVLFVAFCLYFLWSIKDVGAQTTNPWANQMAYEQRQNLNNWTQQQHMNGYNLHRQQMDQVQRDLEYRNRNSQGVVPGLIQLWREFK